MPTFAYPWALLLLPALPVLLRLWARRRRAAFRYSSTRLVQGLPAGRSLLARRGGLILRGLGLLALVVALAGPQWPEEGGRVSTEGISIALVLDVSASMNEADFDWEGEAVSRLEAARRTLRNFIAGGEAADGAPLAGRGDDLLALVTFSSYPETACPLTLDHAALLKILAGQEPRTAAVEATTNLGDAVAWALHALRRAPTRNRAIVLLTDGENNVPTGLKPRQAGQLAGNLGVPIYALGVSPIGASGADPGDHEEARKALAALAEMTGGAYREVTDRAALADAMHRVERLERDRIEGPETRRYHEGAAWFAAAALACWAAATVLESTRWRIAP